MLPSASTVRECASPFSPCTSDRSPAACVFVHPATVTSSPRASFATRPPPPPPPPGGTKKYTKPPQAIPETEIKKAEYQLAGLEIQQQQRSVAEGQLKRLLR